MFSENNFSFIWIIPGFNDSDRATVARNWKTQLKIEKSQTFSEVQRSSKNEAAGVNRFPTFYVFFVLDKFRHVKSTVALRVPKNS